MRDREKGRWDYRWVRENRSSWIDTKSITTNKHNTQQCCWWWWRLFTCKIGTNDAMRDDIFPFSGWYFSFAGDFKYHFTLCIHCLVQTTKCTQCSVRFWSRYNDGLFFLGGGFLTMKSDLLFYDSFLLMFQFFSAPFFSHSLFWIVWKQSNFLTWYELDPMDVFLLSSLYKINMFLSTLSTTRSTMEIHTSTEQH